MTHAEWLALIARVVDDSHRTEPLPRSEFDRATADRTELFSRLRAPDSVRFGVGKKQR